MPHSIFHPVLCNSLQGEIYFVNSLQLENKSLTAIQEGALALEDGVSIHVQQEESFSACSTAGKAPDGTDEHSLNQTHQH